MANIEEARYKVLMTEDGKTLIQASYAIRNNQRNFLKLKLPEGAVVWSAVLSGKPIRPGQAPDGSLLLPLEKGRSGEKAPAFSAELLYLLRGEKWVNNGAVKLNLPVLDLPVSRTGLQSFYPSSYKFTAEQGSFRIQDFQAPLSAALNPQSASSIAGGSSATGSATQFPPVSNDVLDVVNTIGDTQALVDKHRAQTQEGKRAGILPIKIFFPELGPSTFLVSELTAENQASVISFTYELGKKGGVR